MKIITALEGGLAGAAVLTSLHEIIKRKTPEAPRMDLLGMNALSKILSRAFHTTADPRKLFLWTMAGDLVANTLYYSLSGIGSRKTIPYKAAVLGILAGAGALVLPKPLGLNEQYSARTNKTKFLTLALYVAGGIVAGAAIKILESKKR